MEVMPQYVYRPHHPHRPGSHRRSSLPPDFVHRCARHARTHAQLAAGCAVGQARDESAAAATANDAPSTTAQVLTAQDSPGYAAPRMRTLDPAFHPAAVCPSSSQDSTDRNHSFGSRCHSLDDEAAVRQDDGYPGPDGYESDDEKLRPHGVHFADQGRSRESSPEGYPWPLSLAAETADPATLRSILKKSSAKGNSSTSRAVVSS